MVLGKLPVPGRPTILITVGQGPIALAVGAGGGGLDIFTLIYPFSSPSPSLWETARYRLKYCLKGPLNPKQPTNQPTKNKRIPIVFVLFLFFPVGIPTSLNNYYTCINFAKTVLFLPNSIHFIDVEEKSSISYQLSL